MNYVFWSEWDIRKDSHTNHLLFQTTTLRTTSITNGTWDYDCNIVFYFYFFSWKGNNSNWRNWKSEPQNAQNDHLFFASQLKTIKTIKQYFFYGFPDALEKISLSLAENLGLDPIQTLTETKASQVGVNCSDNAQTNDMKKQMAIESLHSQKSPNWWKWSSNVNPPRDLLLSMLLIEVPPS